MFSSRPAVEPHGPIAETSSATATSGQEDVGLYAMNSQLERAAGVAADFAGVCGMSLRVR